MSSEDRSLIDLPTGYSEEKQCPSKFRDFDRGAFSFHSMSLFKAQSQANASEVKTLQEMQGNRELAYRIVQPLCGEQQACKLPICLAF